MHRDASLVCISMKSDASRIQVTQLLIWLYFRGTEAELASRRAMFSLMTNWKLFFKFHRNRILQVSLRFDIKALTDSLTRGISCLQGIFLAGSFGHVSKNPLLEHLFMTLFSRENEFKTDFFVYFCNFVSYFVIILCCKVSPDEHPITFNDYITCFGFLCMCTHYFDTMFLRELINCQTSLKIVYFWRGNPWKMRILRLSNMQIV